MRYCEFCHRGTDLPMFDIFGDLGCFDCAFEAKVVDEDGEYLPMDGEEAVA